jgi:hypothetical protein
MRVGAHLTEGFLIQMELDLERGIVAPKADAVSCRTVISASIWKMECHRCSHRYCAAGSSEVTCRSVWWRSAIAAASNLPESQSGVPSRGEAEMLREVRNSFDLSSRKNI